MPQQSTTSRVRRTCLQCGCLFSAWRNVVSRGGGIFCSWSCKSAHQRVSTLERFWSKVAIAGPDDCWLWQGAPDKYGYGHIWLGGKCPAEGAHRFAYALAHSGIPEGAYILHSCDNPRCVNPKHLRAGSAADNIEDCGRRDRFARAHKANRAGSASPTAKLSEEDVIAIRVRRTDGETFASIARHYHVSDVLVSRICARKAWKHI